jgi:hypothetical protein
LEDELELRPVVLPPAEKWEVARERAAAILGLTLSKLVNASNVEKLGVECAGGGREGSDSLQRVPAEAS